ncbi:MAG: hypothetical protein WBK96_08695 [Candidatus Manganitrophaceae bacterium]
MDAQIARAEAGARAIKMRGVGLARLFFGISNGIVTLLLPIYFSTIGGGPAALGLIEGISRAVERLARGGASAFGGKRSVVWIGTLLMMLQGAFSFARSPLQIFLIRCPVAIGHGFWEREIESGRDFSQRAARRSDRAMEQIGMVLAPVILLASTGLFPLEQRFLLTLPLLFFALLFFFIGDRRKRAKEVDPAIPSSLPPSLLRPISIGAGIAGLGNICDTLLLYRAFELLTRDHGVAQAASLTAFLFMLSRLFYALPGAVARTGWIGKKRFLPAGYCSLALVYLGFIFVPPVKSYVGPLPALLLLFFLMALSGIGQGTVDRIEQGGEIDSASRPFIRWSRGVTDPIANIFVGFLWSVISPTAGFVYAAAMTLSGAVVLLYRGNDPESWGKTAFPFH